MLSPHLQVNKLVCYYFMDVGKKTESYQVRDKDFIAPGTASSRSFSILAKATLSITLAAVPGYTSFAGLH